MACQSVSAVMDEQASSGLNPNADAPYRQRASAYFEQSKESQDAWEVCADASAKGVYSDDHVKFFCFQVSEHQIKFRHAGSSAPQQQSIRETSMKWSQTQSMNAHPEKAFIRNKAAQVFALTFVMEYLTSWPKFFFDISSSVGSNPSGVDIYSRTSMAIDAEVVDRDIVHTPEETRRNTSIKDSMREQVIPSSVESWFQISTAYQRTHPELTCQCSEVVGAYVSWIDLNLIANDRFVNSSSSQMSMEDLREEACDCSFEIVNKGMDPVDKTKSVESSCQVSQSAGFFNVEQEEDVDFSAKFSRSVNGMGQSSVSSWTKSAKSGNAAEAAETSRAVEAKVPSSSQSSAHEDDDISTNMVGFCYDYSHVLKQLPQSTEQQKANVEAVMSAVMKKSTYDDEYNFENEGEDEAMFVEYRKQSKMSLDRSAQVSPESSSDAVRRVFTATMQTLQTAPFMEVEVAVRSLYMSGEASPASHGAHFSGDTAKTSASQDMMRTSVSCGVSGYNHSSVSSEFFETVVRYDKFFIVEPHHIPNVSMAFSDQRGSRHSSPKVRSRVAYSFSRFIKTSHKHMTAFIEDISTRVQDSSELAPPENGFPASSTSDDQLFMFEAAGVLIVSGDSPVERKQVSMRSSSAPSMDAFRSSLAKSSQESAEERQAASADCSSHAVGFASRTSKAFSNKQTVKQCGCTEVYRDCSQCFSPASSCPVQRGASRSAVRSFSHRMIICSEEEVSPFVPAASEHMSKDCEAKDSQEFIPLISQITAKFKRQVSPFSQQIFMPSVSAIFEVSGRPAEENDQTAASEKQMSRRSYFAFIQTMAGSGMNEVSANQGAEPMERVSFTIIQGAVDFPDPIAQKTCFIISTRSVESWGGKDGMVGFPDFIYKHIVPACFSAPLKPTFDSSDAQTVSTSAECALTSKMIHLKRGSEFVQFSQQEYSPSSQVTPEISQESCHVSQQPDIKVSKNYIKAFFQRAKL